MSSDLKRILVVGRAGQLAGALKLAFEQRGRESNDARVFLGRPELDIRSRESVCAALDRLSPALVVNTAAYTAVDKAESEAEDAHALNAVAAGRLGEECAIRGIPLIHVSTDYVFDGASTAPYAESARTNPIGVYGKTKLQGEERILAAGGPGLIVRTAWVYSQFGGNFVKTMLRLARERDEVRVVADQVGSPTNAVHLAAGLLDLADRVLERGVTGATVYHLAGAGQASWADIASETFQHSARRGGPSARVVRITTDDYPTPAPRPANSRLDCALIKADWGVVLPAWEKGVADCVAAVLREG